MLRRLLAPLSLSFLAACGTPAPTCAPRGASYTVCSNKDVWECPVGAADVVSFNQGVDAACEREADPTGCILKANYKMVDMVLKADCDAGGQVCVSSAGPGARTASCQMP